MNTKERYVATMSKIEADQSVKDKIYREVNQMEERKMRRPNKVLAPVLSVLLLFALTTGVYASDLGGIRSHVNTFLYGQATEVEIEEVSPGNFELTYPDGTVRSTGGMAEDGKGGWRPVTMDEIINYLNNSPEVEIDEDGTATFFYHDHVIDITDDLKDDQLATITIKDGVLGKTFKVQMDAEGGFSIQEQ